MTRNRSGRHYGEDPFSHAPEGRFDSPPAWPDKHGERSARTSGSGNYSERAAKPWAEPEAARGRGRAGRRVFQPEEDYDEENLEFIPNSYGGRHERRDMMRVHEEADHDGIDSGVPRGRRAPEQRYSGIGEHPHEHPRAGHRGKGPKGYQPSDERLKDRLEEALYDDDYLDASGIEVRVKDGEVTLQGEVEDREARRRAEDLTEHVMGRHIHINNNLHVKRH